MQQTRRCRSQNRHQNHPVDLDHAQVVRYASHVVIRTYAILRMKAIAYALHHSHRKNENQNADDADDSKKIWQVMAGDDR